MWWLYIAALTLAALAALEIAWRLLHPLRSLKDTHVVIVGGSSGIGKALAKLICKEGSARAVTIIARSQTKLESASAEIQREVSTDCDISVFSADTTKPVSMGEAVAAAVAEHGAVDMLFHCAGAARPGYFLDTTLDSFRETMELNYLGTVTAVKSVLPGMMARRTGHLVLVSSAAGISGWIGYSSYTPTKFAVRGLADALRNELTGFNIAVSIAYPPDTTTPGFEAENLTKPRECLELFPPEHAYSADTVAKAILRSVRLGDFHCSCPDVLADLLISFMAGVTPRRLYVVETLLQPLLCVVTAVFRVYADRVSSRYAKRFKAGSATESVAQAAAE